MDIALWALYLLAVIDGLLTGYRDALGRNPLHYKAEYFMKGSLRGVALTHGVLVLTAIGIVMCYQISGALGLEDEALTRTAASYARKMTWVYMGYAGMIAAGLSVYVMPMFELRSYMTIGLFGVMTLLRPWVLALGVSVAAWHVYGAPGWWLVTGVAAGTTALMSRLEAWHRALGWNAFDWDELMKNP